MGEYHRPVCIETLVGPLHLSSVERWGRQQTTIQKNGPRDTACTRLECCKILYKLYSYFHAPRNEDPIPFFGHAGQMTGYAPHKSRGCHGKFRPGHTASCSSQHLMHNRNTPHIFNCTKINTNLMFLDLWTTPVDMGKLLAV